MAGFLGRGWSFPPTFGAGGNDVAMVEGEEDIHQSLGILVSTQPGERVMQEAFGCDMSRFAFEEIDAGLRGEVRRIVSDAILYHEARIDLLSLSVDQAQDGDGVLLIALEYAIRGTNSRYNMVFPFYVDEATAALT